MRPQWWEKIPESLRLFDSNALRLVPVPKGTWEPATLRFVLYVLAAMARQGYEASARNDHSLHEPWESWIESGNPEFLGEFLRLCRESAATSEKLPQVAKLLDRVSPEFIAELAAAPVFFEADETPTRLERVRTLLTLHLQGLRTATVGLMPMVLSPPEGPSPENASWFEVTIEFPDGVMVNLEHFVLVACAEGPNSGELLLLDGIDENGGLRYLDSQRRPWLREPFEYWEAEGKFFRQKDDLTRAEAWLLRSWNEGRRSHMLRMALVGTFRQQCVSLIREGRVEDALTKIRASLEHVPDHPQLLFLKAHCYFKTDRIAQCIAILRSLARREKASPEIFELIGKCFERRKSLTTAVRYYERGLSKHPESSRLRNATEKARTQLAESAPSMPTAKQTEENTFKLENYVIDLNKRVGLNQPNPLPGRDRELDEALEILSCRYKRNLIIVGDPGVGKSSLVTEIVRRVVAEELPASWRNLQLFQLNVASLVAGARFRGQYEERLLDTVDALARMSSTALFIDDMHTFFNSAGNRSGNLDASHVFKPALASGDIQMIGATSEEHFRISLANDPAVMRSFQVVRLKEPEDEALSTMVDEVARDLEEFHDVVIDETARASAASLSKIFVRNRALPDKAVNLLDLACVLGKEDGAPDEETSGVTQVTSEHVVAATSRRSGVPAEKITSTDNSRFAEMESFLRSKIIGQEEAIVSVAKVLRVSRMGLQLKPEQPDGVFLFAGPTGVGKTELALAMTEFLFGDRRKMLRIDMSEFMEHISTSKLIGIAPGYVGYHDKNQLTDRVRQEPYSLVLLDEIEKASPQVLNLFLQVFDTGRLTDSKGGTVHFDHTVFVLTSNLGTDLYGRSVVGYGAKDAKGVAPGEMMRALKSHLSPEFINRLDEKIFFSPLSEGDMRRILDIQLDVIRERLERMHNISLVFDEAALKALVEAGFNPEFGARELHRAIRGLLLDPLAKFLMEKPSAMKRTLEVRGKDLGDVNALRVMEEVASDFDSEVLSFAFSDEG